MVCGHAHCLSFSFRLRGAGFGVEQCTNYMPYEKLCGHVVAAMPWPPSDALQIKLVNAPLAPETP